MRNFPKAALTVLLLPTIWLAGCSSAVTPTDTPPAEAESTEVEVDVPTESAPAADTFVDGVLTTEALKIEITDYKVLPVGAPGNEYSEVPVLAIWYNTTNLGTTDQDVTPTDFIFHFEAFQDNDPNQENSLDVGSLPDPAFLETQLENIKPGGTAANAIAYELDDTTTPVELVAGFFGDEIGRMTFNLN